jgi:hypothetical protein
MAVLWRGFTSARAQSSETARDSAASRISACPRVGGVMNRVLRCAWAMLVRAARTRSADQASSSASPALPCTTAASIQASEPASSMPEFMPRTPKIGSRCAASPARSTGPWRYAGRVSSCAR